jgi:hypothetical protein
MPASMFSSGLLIIARSAFSDAISRYVLGMSCISPRAPTRLRASGSRLLSAIPCALNTRQSKAGPKERFAAFRKVSS